MAPVNDLSRCLMPFDQNSTLVVIVEMSEASWLVCGAVPGVERQPLKKLKPDAPELLRLVERGEARLRAPADQLRASCWPMKRDVMDSGWRDG
jgi:hypothetical protein